MKIKILIAFLFFKALRNISIGRATGKALSFNSQLQKEWTILLHYLLDSYFSNESIMYRTHDNFQNH